MGDPVFLGLLCQHKERGGLHHGFLLVLRLLWVNNHWWATLLHCMVVYDQGTLQRQKFIDISSLCASCQIALIPTAYSELLKNLSDSNLTGTNILKSIWQYTSKSLKMEALFDPVISLLGLHFKETIIYWVKINYKNMNHKGAYMSK